VNDVFSSPKPVFIAISSADAGTVVYLNGIVVKKAATFTFSSQELSGQLVLGNAPNTSNNWSGKLTGLAVYHRELSPAEVLRHFADREKSNHARLDSSERIVADYLFDEGQGDVVRNQVDSVTNLLIPARFFVLRQPVLERPWDEFRSDRNYWLNIAINIGGFVPLGFVFRAYFSAIEKVKRGTWFTVALGFAVSLTIEVLQAFLPTRNSGMTDLVTNTFGTVLGAILCVWCMKHNWFAPPVISLLLPVDEQENLRR
jgi:VanZ family protein